MFEDNHTEAPPESELLAELRGRVQDSAEKNQILRSENAALRAAISKIVNGSQKHSPGSAAATVSVDDLVEAMLLVR